MVRSIFLQVSSFKNQTILAKQSQGTWQLDFEWLNEVQIKRISTSTIMSFDIDSDGVLTGFDSKRRWWQDATHLSIYRNLENLGALKSRFMTFFSCHISCLMIPDAFATHQACPGWLSRMKNLDVLWFLIDFKCSQLWECNMECPKYLYTCLHMLVNTFKHTFVCMFANTSTFTITRCATSSPNPILWRLALLILSLLLPLPEVTPQSLFILKIIDSGWFLCDFGGLMLGECFAPLFLCTREFSKFKNTIARCSHEQQHVCLHVRFTHARMHTCTHAHMHTRCRL